MKPYQTVKNIPLKTSTCALFIFLFFSSFSHALTWDDARKIYMERKYKKMVDVHSLIIQYTEKLDLPSPELFAALILVESAANPCAKSHAGAVGLTQLMPLTAKAHGVKDRYNVRQNIMGGAKTLRESLDIAKGDIPLALAIYNFGPKAKRIEYSKWPKETKNYIVLVPRKLAYLKKVGWKNKIPKSLPYQNERTCRLS